MTEDAKGLFPELTPPPGGLQALKQRLDGEEGRRRPGAQQWVLATSLVTVAGACLLAFLLAVPEGQPGIGSDINPALIRLGIAEPAPEPVRVPRDHRNRVAVERVDVDSSRIVFYRVAVLPDQGL